MGNLEISTLNYNGHVISDKDDMLSLTDMWKAAGADPQKAPAKWRALPSAKAFIEHVEVTIGKSDNDLVRTVNGGKTPGTWAHWQVGMAYAKYLDPNFHMWCNEVVRERMEGKSVSVASLPPEVLEMIRRDDGISRMLAHKVTGIESTVQTLANAVAAIASVVSPPNPGLYIQGKTSGEIWSAAGLPKIKNGARWLGNRLSEMGCQIDDCRSVRLGMRSARLFDPDKAATCMKNGLLLKAKAYSSERVGQGRLRLVSSQIEQRPTA